MCEFRGIFPFLPAVASLIHTIYDGITIKSFERTLSPKNTEFYVGHHIYKHQRNLMSQFNKSQCQTGVP